MTHPASPTFRTLDLGETLFSAQAEADTVFRVESGHILLFKTLPGQRRQILAVLTAGDYFGLPVCGRRDCAAACLSPALVAEWPLAALPPRSLRLAAEAHLAAAMPPMLDLGRKTALERVASFLMHLQRRRLDLPLRISLAADCLGLRVETISRALHQLQRDGIILNPAFDGTSMILNPAALEQIAQGRTLGGALPARPLSSPPASLAPGSAI